MTIVRSTNKGEKVTSLADKKKKVVIYARVSTEHEAQLLALKNQKDW